ncbi:MAG: class I SAM-dependent methyltransferase [Candidatus Margulisiibacteriota bacterium]
MKVNKTWTQKVTIRTHHPNYQTAADHAQRGIQLKKAARKVLGFTPNVSPGEMGQIGAALYLKDLIGSDYTRDRINCQNDPTFLRIQRKAKDPKVRKIIAEMSAWDDHPRLTRPNQLPPNYVATIATDIALRGIGEHLPPETSLRVLVAGAGLGGNFWLAKWPGGGTLTLNDKIPYMAEFLAACAAFHQERDATILEGSVLDLPQTPNSYNVIHAGNFLPYLKPEESVAFFDLVLRILPKRSEERLFIYQQTVTHDRIEDSDELVNILNEGSSLNIVKRSLVNTSHGNLLTLFMR